MNIVQLLILPAIAADIAPAAVPFEEWLRRTATAPQLELSLSWLADLAVLAALSALLFWISIAWRAPRTHAVRLSGLRALRRRQGLSFVELAARTGLRARLLFKMEYGMRPLDPEHGRLIAEVLGVAPQLLAPAGSQHPPQSERWGASVLSIPVHPALTDADRLFIVDSLLSQGA
jgi:transcriptional regulator with XRE-family HTH domain